MTGTGTASESCSPPRRPLALRSVNLNLLPILLTLLRHRNVTHAANELHLTQSAVSGSLRRLRELFDDELMVFNGRELLLTEKAKELLPQLEQLQASAESVLGGAAFDPGSANVRFRITTADWLSFLLVPTLHRKLDTQAPGVSVQFMQGSDRVDAKELRQGFADLLIGPERISDWTNLNLFNDDSEYRHERVFVDRLVGIASTRHPLPDLENDRESYLRHPHLTFNLGPRLHASMERDTLNDAGLKQNDQFLLPEFTTLPYLVAATGATALVPLSIARQMTKLLPIRAFEPPLDFEPIKLIMVWAKLRDHDAALSWFRGLVRQSFHDLVNPESLT